MSFAEWVCGVGGRGVGSGNHLKNSRNLVVSSDKVYIQTLFTRNTMTGFGNSKGPPTPRINDDDDDGQDDNGKDDDKYEKRRDDDDENNGKPNAFNDDDNVDGHDNERGDEGTDDDDNNKPGSHNSHDNNKHGGRDSHDSHDNNKNSGHDSHYMTGVLGTSQSFASNEAGYASYFWCIASV